MPSSSVLTHAYSALVSLLGMAVPSAVVVTMWDRDTVSSAPLHLFLVCCSEAHAGLGVC